uniref:Uncharacterized protein n=1 Tax=Knipowitschia caucasica TaxID=637954 RepID=A0AAV2KU64_KNICA
MQSMLMHCLKPNARVAAMEDREYQMDRLDFVRNQLNLLIEEIKKKIKAISEDVESKVVRSMVDLWGRTEGKLAWCKASSGAPWGSLRWRTSWPVI